MIKNFILVFYCSIILIGMGWAYEEFPICCAPGDQLNPDVAYDGNNFWVVWGDGRPGTAGIYGTRITVNGEVLDTGGILLVSGSSFIMPSVAFGDSIGCVAFQDSITHRNPDSFQWKDFGFVKFYNNGELINEIPVMYDYFYMMDMGGIFYRDVPCVVFGKEHFFFFVEYYGWYYYEGGDGIDILGLIKDGDSLIGITGIGGEANTSYSVTAIWNGNEFFSTWIRTYWAGNPYSTIKGKFFEDSLYEQSDTSDTITIRTGDEFPAWVLRDWHYSPRDRELAYSGNQYLLISEGGNFSPLSAIWFDVLSGNGNPIKSSPTIINNIDSLTQMYPTCGYKDNKFIAVWQMCEENHEGTYKNSNLYGIIIDTLGNIISSSYISGNSWNKIQPSITVGNNKCLLVWADNRNGDYDICGMFVDSLECVNKDVGVLSIDNTVGDTIFVDSTLHIKATIKNFGKSSDTFYVFCAVDTGNIVWCDSEEVYLESESSKKIEFSHYIDFPMDMSYNITVYTSLVGDANNSNDTLEISVKLVSIEERSCVTSSVFLKCEPNPFTTVIRIKWVGINNQKISLQIYDLSGRLVKSFPINSINLINSIMWDGTNTQGKKVVSGVYFVKLNAGKFKETKKLTLIRR